MPDLNRLGCTGMNTGAGKMRPQSPASSRLRPIRAANETTNRTAACVKVGACVGAKTGAAASVDGMMNTFDECGEFWKMGGRGDHILSLGPRYVSDSGADVYSRQATRPVLMRLIGGRRKQHCRRVRMVYV